MTDHESVKVEIVQGPTGATGAAGAAGAEGRPGYTGNKGRDGARGPSGTLVLPRNLALKITAAFTVAVLSLSFGLTLWISHRDKQSASRDAQGQAHAACERALKFAPGIALDLKRRHVLSPALLREYVATIPRSCP